MNVIENIVNGAAASTTHQVAEKKPMGKEDFLKMLIAQLKNQDPMNPLQGTEFAAQLAQFSSVEQLTNLNSTLTAQNQRYTELVNAQSIGLIGKEVTANKAAGDSKTTITGQVTAVNFKDQSLYLTINGEDIPFSDVVSVRTTSSVSGENI